MPMIMKENQNFNAPDDYRDDFLGKNRSGKKVRAKPQETSQDTLPQRKRTQDLGDSL